MKAIEGVQARKYEVQTARVIRTPPRATQMLRERIRCGNLGLRDPRSIVQGRNTLFAMFGGKVPLRPAVTKDGAEPYLIAPLALNRNVAAGAANCLQISSAGRICSYPNARIRYRVK